MARIGILCLLAFLSVLALAGGKPDIRKEIRAAYAVYAKAVMDRNIDHVMASLTDDVVWVQQPGKSENRDEVKKEMETFLRAIGPGVKFWLTFKSIDQTGPDEAVAVVQTHFQAPGKPERKAPKGGQVFVWRDTWVKTGGVWRNKLGVVELWTGK